MESDAAKCLSSDQSRNWLELPPEVTAVILKKVGAVDILINAHRVCTAWRSICKDPSMWRSIDMQLGAVCDSWFEVDFEAMARHAVDRSCGQLVDISVAQFATDGFIHYIAQSSRQIRRLQIVSCHALSEDVLKETASKFPMLEELKVQSTQFSVAAVEAVGRCCPQLKTFKCNVFGYDEEEDPVGEEEQEAILGIEEVEEEEAAAEQEIEEEDGFEIDEENLNDGGDDYWDQEDD
uniref:F-box domain-containing protein n=1 Tax=Kalanchoe fedtschenkoi TaxID=63787 RepID=A0A7N1A7E1_KALFE